MKHCVHTTRAFNSEKIYKPIGKEVMRVELEQNKLNEAYRILEESSEITDLQFSNRLFVYKNEIFD